MTDKLKTCNQCGGEGWYILGEENNPEQVQCEYCCGEGKVAAQYLEDVVEAAYRDHTGQI